MIDDLAGVTVEFGFGVDAVGGDYFVLNDPDKGELDNAVYLLAPDTVFVDVTTSVRSIDIQRGWERELDECRTGSATIVLNDNDRTFDPAYSGSPWYGQITPMRRVRIMSAGDELFAGWVDDWSVTYERGDNLSRVVAMCVDEFAILANQELTEIAAAHAGDLSGARVTRVLDRAEVSFPATRSIDTGNATFGATTFGDNALAYLQSCARAEAGYLYVSADGTLMFRDRLTTLNEMSGVTFSDDPAAGIPYLDVTLRSAADLLYTRVTGSSETTSTEMIATADAATTDEYRIRTLALGSLFLSDDSQTQDIVDYYLERFSAPEVRFQSATFNMAALTSAQIHDIVTLDLTDVVTVERSPMNVGSAIERVSMVTGIAHRIGPGKWTTELAFANVDTRAFLTLDDSSFGVLDTNRVAF